MECVVCGSLSYEEDIPPGWSHLRLHVDPDTVPPGYDPVQEVYFCRPACHFRWTIAMAENMGVIEPAAPAPMPATIPAIMPKGLPS